jgi:hypothetical protein
VGKQIDPFEKLEAAHRSPQLRKDVTKKTQKKMLASIAAVWVSFKTFVFAVIHLLVKRKNQIIKKAMNRKLIYRSFEVWLVYRC